MKTRLLLFLVIAWTASGDAWAQRTKSNLPVEPGTISLEELLAKPLRLTVKKQSTIFYQATMDRVLGIMEPNTIVTVVGMSDKAYRVRGRARHGDVAGWMKRDDLLSPDPKLHEKLKALYDRQQTVSQMIAAHQVGIGMTRAEVQQSLGKPTRTSTKINAGGREDRVEYAVFEKVPQQTFGRTPDGQLVQSIIYVKVEVGTLSISFKNDLVDTIEETKGSPLHGAAVKIVPGPIVLF